jgi:hypothetical protein
MNLTENLNSASEASTPDKPTMKVKNSPGLLKSIWHKCDKLTLLSILCITTNIVDILFGRSANNFTTVYLMSTIAQAYMIYRCFCYADILGMNF